MTVYAFASAKGSPGVSTTAAAVAAAWPAPVVLADVDPAGGDVMWRNRSATGGPLDPDRGLLSLGAAVRRGAAEADLTEHLQRTAMGTDVLVGLASPDQLAGLGAAWGQLPTVFSQHRCDVLVDCGRMVPGSAATPVFTGADVVVLVTRPDIAGTAHLRERVRSLRASLGIGGPGGKPVGIVVRTPYRDTRSAADLQQLLDADRMGVTVLGIVADEPKAASIISGERVGQFRKTLLGRSAAQLAQRLAGDHHAADLAERPMSMDQQLVRALREQVADIISRQRRDDADNHLPPMSAEDERQFARAVVGRVLDQYAREEVRAGRTPPTPTEEQSLADGIHAALFGVGRLQPLLDDPEVENIDINGFDQVFVGYADGREERVEPVAESDDELIELVQTLGAYSGLTSRPFDTANPQLDIRLPDGSRLSAVMGVCPRPSISIRRARLSRVSLDTLVDYGTLSPDLAAFLSAAVRARKNIMIAGATNAGKTTLLRALANEIEPAERLITVERALELGLGEFADLHPNVVALEERLPNAEGVGSIAMAELVRRSLRMNPSRVIVGEVLGDEIVTMLNAMSQGNDGSLSTIHANSSAEVFNRICTYAIQSAERLPSDATMMLIGGAIDFVIFIERLNEFAEGGTLRRMITSVREVNGVDGRVLSSEVFARGREGNAVPAAAVSCLPELEAAGYRPGAAATWVERVG